VFNVFDEDIFDAAFAPLPCFPFPLPFPELAFTPLLSATSDAKDEEEEDPFNVDEDEEVTFSVVIVAAAPEGTIAADEEDAFEEDDFCVCEVSLSSFRVCACVYFCLPSSVADCGSSISPSNHYVYV